MQEQHFLGVLLAVLALPLFGNSVLHAEGEEKPAPPEPSALPRNVTFLPPEVSFKRGLYLEVLEQQAREHTIPPELADAVAFVESAYDPTAIGRAGEIGLMQVLPDTAAMLGFKGSEAELAEPKINIRLGVRYLAGAWRLSGGDLCRALMKYRAGHGEELMSPRSVEYCRRARAYLAALGSPLVTSISVPVEVVAAQLETRNRTIPMSRPSTAGRKTAVIERGRRFWAAHEARIRALTAQVHAKWARLAKLTR